MTAQTPAEMEAERLLPDTGCNCTHGRLERLGYHDQWCTLYYRPAVAEALATRDAEIASLKDRIARLEADNAAVKHELLKAGRALSCGGCKWRKGCLRASAWEHDANADPQLIAELDDIATSVLAALSAKPSEGG